MVLAGSIMQCLPEEIYSHILRTYVYDYNMKYKRELNIVACLPKHEDNLLMLKFTPPMRIGGTYHDVHMNLYCECCGEKTLLPFTGRWCTACYSYIEYA